MKLQLLGISRARSNQAFSFQHIRLIKAASPTPLEMSDRLSTPITSPFAVSGTQVQTFVTFLAQVQ